MMAKRMMGSQRNKIEFGFPYVLILWFCVVYVTFSTVAAGRVVLTGDNVTLSVDDIEANFAMPVQASGECGVLHVATPIDGCARLLNNDIVEGAKAPYVLMVRGGCTFEDKVRRAQSAGFQAAIIYNNDDAGLVAMAGNSAGIKIHAVFISKDSGEILRQYVDYTNMQIWLIPTIENSAWSIMAISFISLLAMSAVLATCFFVRRHRIRRDRPRTPRVREFHGMSSRLVKAMPSLIFTAVLEDNCTSRTCAICLEDYSVGEKIRILPCRHKFHAACVDSWLTSWRTFCPVCKRDARTSNGDPPASESTPLLSSTSLSISASFSSIQSSLASSSIQIAHPSPQSRAYSPYLSQSRRSYTNSPHSVMSQSRSSLDLRNPSSSQRSYASHLLASHSQSYSQSLGLGYPGLSRYGSAYLPSSSNASPSYVGSSSRQQYLLHCSESATSFSPFTSAQSLPGVDAI